MSLLSQIVPEWVKKRGEWLERGAPGQAITDQRPVILPQRVSVARFKEVWDFPLLGGRLVKDGWLFPQELPERGKGLIIGTARSLLERGRGKPRTEEEREARHKTIFGNLAGCPIMDRPRPLLDLVREKRFLGSAGLMNPQKAGVTPETLTETQRRLAESFREGIASALGVSPTAIREEPIEKWITEWTRAYVKEEYWAQVDARSLGERIGRIVKEALRRERYTSQSFGG